MALYFCFPYLLPLGLLGKNKRHILGFYLIAFLSYLNTHVSVDPVVLKSEAKGIGYFTIEKIRHPPFKNGSFLSYQGALTYFSCNGEHYTQIPCTVLVKNTKGRPLANCDYLVEAKLRYSNHHFYNMVVDHWTPVEKTFSLAELRLNLKDRLRLYFKKHTTHPLTCDFFSSLGTGGVESKLLQEIFRWTGLSHTLAISGFQYSWLLFALIGVASLFCPGRMTPVFLLISITLYFFFIGESASIKRAWMTSAIFCVGMMLSNKPNGLNSLGIAAAFSLIIDPESLFSIGYQLSYMATYAILTIFPTADLAFQKLFPNWKLEELRQLRWHERSVVKSAQVIRQMISLSIVASLSTAPICLTHFGEYSWTGIFFNFFLPTAMTLSLLGVFASLIPWIGPTILSINEWYSKNILEILYWCGSNSTQMIIYPLSTTFAIGITSSLILLGAYLEYRRTLLTRIKLLV